jgi:hypothetical protein
MDVQEVKDVNLTHSIKHLKPSKLRESSWQFLLEMHTLALPLEILLHITQLYSLLELQTRTLIKLLLIQAKGLI